MGRKIMFIEARQDWLTALYDTMIMIRRSSKQELQMERQSTQSVRVVGNGKEVGDTPYGLTALQNECQELRTTAEGGRNQRLNNAAFKMGQLVAADKLRHDTAYRDLFDAAFLSGLPGSEVE